LTLVDTNVLLDLATDDPTWVEWSIRALEAAAVDGPLLINSVVYAEFSTRYERIEDVDEFLGRAGVDLVEISRPALFLAAKVHARYRASGGTKTGVLPDFFVGAHASVGGVPILTRDIGRYRTYFPSVGLISPNLV
jgi:predicted nucleic acid-binding protein